jgi:hypothetical protein
MKPIAFSWHWPGGGHMMVVKGYFTVNAGNYAALGFESVDEVRQATFGEPLQVDQVRLDALRAFNEQTNPETLLVDIRRDCIPSKPAPAWPAPAISSCTCPR